MTYVPQSLGHAIELHDLDSNEHLGFGPSRGLDHHGSVRLGPLILGQECRNSDIVQGPRAG